MKQDQQGPVPAEALANLRQQMPMGLKLRLLVRNTWHRIRNRSMCCGHPGEPGC
jgi:hypothetical protein